MDFKNIKINGRYFIKNQELHLFNCGSGIAFKMKGKSFTLLIDSVPSNGYYYVIIDRNYQNKVKCNEKRYKYSFKDDNAHLVDIVKVNEANNNALVIKDLKVDGELLEYDHRYDKRVMVYGDSTAAGFGILSHDVASIHTSDGVRDFIYHALYELNYDMDIFSASGYGLAFSIYTRPQYLGVYDYFNKVAICKSEPWDINQKIDLLIVSLGTNDESYIEDDLNKKEERINEFKQKYKALIEAHVKNNLDLKILMIYGTLKEENVYYLIEETYVYLKQSFNNLYIHKFNGNNTAVSHHAYITAHEKMAGELKELINNLLNK